MKDELIGIECAKLAKEKGFKESCDNYYDDDIRYTTPQLYDGDIIKDGYYHDDYYLAPTQSLLQKWLREKHKIHITITSISQESWQYHISNVGDKLGNNYGEDYNTYEEALEQGLIEALKLIK